MRYRYEYEDVLPTLVTQVGNGKANDLLLVEYLKQDAYQRIEDTVCQVVNVRGEISQRADSGSLDLQRLLLEEEGIGFESVGCIELDKCQ